MIGGVDIPLISRAGASSSEVSVRAIRQIWPGAVFENGLTGDYYPQFRQVPFGELEELFVYRDLGAAKAWDDEGAVPETYNSMIHLIVEEERLTVVIDERDAEMESMIAAINSALRDEIHFIQAFREAA